MVLDHATLKAIDAEASTLMKRGLALMRERRADTIAEAVHCFDRARELRDRLPGDIVPRFAYGLAACWLNRGEALLLLNDQARLAEAARAFDEAIAVLEDLPLDEDSRFARRLAVARHNRGLVLQALGRSREAQIDFTRALAILDEPRAATIADRELLLAVVWTNLSNLHAADESDDDDTLAFAAARRALAIVSGAEGRNADAAEAGLKARHVLCRICARRLSPAAASGALQPDEVHDATDFADEGLALVEHWERQGVSRFRNLAVDLFRFGVLVYERYQPQFVAEFVAEHLDPSRSALDYVRTVEAAAIRDGHAQSRKE